MAKYSFKKNRIARREFEKTVNDLKKMFSDSEVRLLLFWVVIGPLCALAYLIWKKYERFKLIALALFFVSLIYFIGQFGGWWYILTRVFG
jgi:hypothetical protein